MSTVVFSFTEKGKALGEQIQQLLGATHVCNYEQTPLLEAVSKVFKTADKLVFVGAAGIAVRSIAPHIQQKDQDPAVVVIDEAGQFFIPILSGHLGGANQLAQLLATTFGGQAVLTTATDINHCFAVDTWAKQQRLSIVNIGCIKVISGALLHGRKVLFSSCYALDEPLPPFLQHGLPNGETAAMVICQQPPTVFLPQTLYLIPQEYVLGIGCRKNIAYETLETVLYKLLHTHGIPIKSLRAIGSITIKKEEPALLALAQKHQLPLSFYSAAALSKVNGNFSSSTFVKSTVGVDNVCERAACLLSNGPLVIAKTPVNGVTLAVAKYNWRCSFVSCPNWR